MEEPVLKYQVFALGKGWGTVGDRFRGRVRSKRVARGIGALNLKVVRNIMLSWIVTLPAGGILAILFFFLLKGIFLN